MQLKKSLIIPFVAMINANLEFYFNSKENVTLASFSILPKHLRIE